MPGRLAERLPIVSAALLVAACTQQLGEALIVVDTDLPVPQLVGRLRVDLHAPDGTWFESRDIARPDPRDWPVSFSVYSDDPLDDKLVSIRLRAYPEGHVRDYRGERFRERPAFVEPFVAGSVAELCAE